MIDSLIGRARDQQIAIEIHHAEEKRRRGQAARQPPLAPPAPIAPEDLQLAQNGQIQRQSVAAQIEVREDGPFVVQRVNIDRFFKRPAFRASAEIVQPHARREVAPLTTSVGPSIFTLAPKNRMVEKSGPVRFGAGATGTDRRGSSSRL